MDRWPLEAIRPTRRQTFAAIAGGLLAMRAQGQAPGKSGMIVRSARPLDLEMPLSGFADYITPIEHFFVRTHVYSPAVDAQTWRLTVDGAVNQALTLTLDDLRKLPAVEIVSVLECAGNGRAFYDPPVAGLQWQYGAVGNGRWRGIRLADLLKRAGVRTGAVEVLFDGADAPIGKMADFRRSIPLKKALDPDTLLAFELNGQPLPKEHGFPLRAVVPGWAGDSWAKWITGLRVLTEPDSGYWMASTYKHPGHPVAPGTVLPAASIPTLTSLRVKSVIASPEPGTTLKPGEPTSIRGVAWSGDGGPAHALDVSVDNGRTWAPGRFLDPESKWGWRRWEFKWTPRSEQYYSILARARTATGNVQPVVQEWNQSGYLWNVVARVGVNVASQPPATSSASSPRVDLPAQVKTSCVVCHDDDVIRQQRLTRAQWDREITKMTDWGAQIEGQNRSTLIDSLFRSVLNENVP